MSYTDSSFFIGRDGDLQKITDILLADSCRLLTILGIGGIGKTDLVLNLARNLDETFEDDIIFIDLQHIDNQDALIPAILDTLQIKIQANSFDNLIAYITDKYTLLILDNFENLLDATPILSNILNAAPNLKILVTSRVALRLQEEHIYSLLGLSTPVISADDMLITQSSSVQLFLNKARQVRHDFQPDLQHVAEICRIVDGNPLAIQLASVWAKVLDSGEILREIRDCIDFLQTDLRNVPERHRNIRAVFSGSWKLLSEKAQQALRRLVVFHDGFDREAASVIAEINLVTLMELCDKSLLVVAPDGRYQMHTLIRQLALKYLEEDDKEAHEVHQRHSQYYAEYTHIHGKMLRGKQQHEALENIQGELQNIRAGWFYAVDNADSASIEKYLFGIALYHQMKSHTQEALDILTIPQKKFDTMPNYIQVQLQLLRGWALIMLWKNEEGVESVWYGINELKDPPIWLGMALIPAINQPELFGDRYGFLIDIVRQALENASDIWQQAWLFKAIGEFDFIAQRYDAAATAFRNSVERFEQVEDAWGSTWAYGNLGRALVNIEYYQAADQIYLKSIEICQNIGDYSGWVDVINKRAELALEQGHEQSAEQLLIHAFQIALQYHTELGTLTYILYTLAKLRIQQNDFAEAVAYLTLLQHEPVLNSGWRQPEIDMLQTRIDAIRPKLSDSEFVASIRQGKSKNLMDTVKSLLASKPRSQIEIAQKTLFSNLVEPLTEREIQVLRLIAAGLSNREIASELILAIGTVKTHAHNLYSKLGVSNRAEATARAYDLNLV